MNKKEVQKRVMQNGKPLALSKFAWDEKTKTFSSNEHNLVIDFSDINSCTFTTGSYCTFKTGGYCTFKTGGSCTFKTGGSCTFKTGGSCTFKTYGSCTFKTGGSCTFKTGGSCTWIINQNEYKHAPLCLSGSLWDLFVNEPGKISIGCETMTIADFEARADDLAKREGMKPEQVEEYRGLGGVAETWMTLKGWVDAGKQYDKRVNTGAGNPVIAQIEQMDL